MEGHEIQTEIEQGQVAEATGTEGAAPAAEQIQESAGTESGATDAIRITESGEVEIDDSFVKEHFVDRTPVSEPVPEPAALATPATIPESKDLLKVYKPEEMAKAFIENKVDEGRIPLEMQAYYKAIMSEQQRKQEIFNIAKPAAPVQTQQLIPPPPPPPTDKPTLSPEDFKQIQEGGKALAVKYLGIKADEFDEFNQQHVNAQNMAMSDIRKRAEDIFQQQTNAKYQQHVQAYQQQQAQIRQQNVAQVVQEFQKNPNWQDIDKNFYPKWLESQDAQTKGIVSGIMAEGNPDRVKAVLGVVTKAYEASKAPTQAVPKQVSAPPAIMSATGTGDVQERKGMADASKLGEMSPEEKASWFIQNQFV